MTELTIILQRLEQGDPHAANELLPLVYDELRKLAAQKMERETPGQTLQATALVHEAWLRLGGDDQPAWDNRGHFFAAAAEAMRRILIDNARRKQALRHGGTRTQRDFAFGGRPALQYRHLPESNIATAVHEMPSYSHQTISGSSFTPN